VSTGDTERVAALDEGVDRDDRPAAEEMLAPARGSGPTEGGRGRLSVYIGITPGVGKTFGMLDEGHRRIADGMDLIVGWVEPRAGDRP